MGHGPCQSMASPNTRTTFRFTEDVKLILVQDYNLRGLERTIYSDRSTTYQTGLNDTKRGSCFPGGRMEEVISPRASQDGRRVLFLRGCTITKIFCSRKRGRIIDNWIVLSVCLPVTICVGHCQIVLLRLHDSCTCSWQDLFFTQTPWLRPLCTCFKIINLSGRLSFLAFYWNKSIKKDKAGISEHQLPASVCCCWWVSNGQQHEINWEKAKEILIINIAIIIITINLLIFCNLSTFFPLYLGITNCRTPEFISLLHSSCITYTQQHLHRIGHILLVAQVEVFFISWCNKGMSGHQSHCM